MVFVKFLMQFYTTHDFKDYIIVLKIYKSDCCKLWVIF
jgi:hypothetical protein